MDNKLKRNPFENNSLKIGKLAQEVKPSGTFKIVSSFGRKFRPQLYSEYSKY